MDTYNIKKAWDLLYQMLSLEINKKYNSLEAYQQSQQNLLTLIPDASWQTVLQIGSEKSQKKIISELFDDIPCESPNKLSMVKELAAIVEKICPEMKSTTQELFSLLNSEISELDMEDQNNNQLLNCLQNFYVNAIKSLPLPIPSKSSLNCEQAVEHIGIQGAVWERLKKEVLPKEIPEILKLIENNDLPTEIVTSPILEDFSVLSSDEPTSNKSETYKCQICARVLRSNVALQYHIRKTHSKMEKSLTCEFCHRAFVFNAELECHKEIHFSKKCMHFCKICDMEFESQHTLEKHVLCHEDEGSYDQVNTRKCKFCRKKFSLELHKENHENLHLFEQYLLVNHSEYQLDHIVSTEHQGKELVENLSYILSPDRSLCFNKATKQVQRVRDIIRPCSIHIHDAFNLAKQLDKTTFSSQEPGLRKCYISLIDIGNIKKENVEN